jgi:hypothetical protein
MTNEELRAQLDEAKEFKAARVAEAEREVADARRCLADAEERLRQWSEMIPYQVMELMAEENRRKVSEQETTEQRSRLEALHASALREANEKHKGMLPPHAASKSTTFGILGATVGGVLAMYIAAFHVGLRNEIGLLLVAAIGGIGGLLAGFEFFNRNFVIDESLERSPFAVFVARDTVRRTYFRNTRD